MTVLEILLLAVGLSMDSLAVSVAGGAVIRRCTAGGMIKIGLFMGVTQAGLTVVGYLLGAGFQRYIMAFDHWIAFLLLLYLGGKMVWENRKGTEEECHTDLLDNKTLLGMSVATSIDALAVGISLALLDSEIVLQASLIGVVTFLMSVFGVYFGSSFGRRIDLRLDLIGGLILIGIGVKILLEHLFFV